MHQFISNLGYFIQPNTEHEQAAVDYLVLLIGSQL